MDKKAIKSTHRALVMINEVYIDVEANALALAAMANEKLGEKSIEYRYLRLNHTARLFIQLHNLLDDKKSNNTNLLNVIRKLSQHGKKALQYELEEIIHKYKTNGLISEIKDRRNKIFGHLDFSFYYGNKNSDRGAERYIPDLFQDMKKIVNKLNCAFELPQCKRHEAIHKPCFVEFYSKLSANL